MSSMTTKHAVSASVNLPKLQPQTTCSSTTQRGIFVSKQVDPHYNDSMFITEANQHYADTTRSGTLHSDMLLQNSESQMRMHKN